MLNGISFLYPQVPNIPVKQHNIGQYFTEHPWNVIGWMPVTFYPIAKFLPEITGHEDEKIVKFLKDSFQSRQ